MDEFLKLRKRLLDALEEASKDNPGKMYEGEMEVAFHYPGIYDEVTVGEDEKDLPDNVIIRADFYLIGPRRHYSWEGTTLAEAVKRASADIDRWIADCKDGDSDADGTTPISE